ncbi:MAG: hypothetical protein ABEJ94_06035 [Halorientalis sp.]
MVHIDSELDPVPCPELWKTVLPLSHPSYQEVWRSRLGYTRAEYVDAVGAAVEELL